jgi:hypothetical protein
MITDKLYVGFIHNKDIDGHFRGLRVLGDVTVSRLKNGSLVFTLTKTLPDVRVNKVTHFRELSNLRYYAKKCYGASTKFVSD